MLIRDIAADLAVVFDGRPDADVDGGEHCLFCKSLDCLPASTPSERILECGLWRVRAAASRIAITRISVGIRSEIRDCSPYRGVAHGPSQGCSNGDLREGSVGSGAIVGFRRISSIEGNWLETADDVMRQVPKPLPARPYHPGVAPQTRWPGEKLRPLTTGDTAKHL